ncbi:MAG: hypothetical protein RIR10_1183 [Planctomycetota bacterium]
MNRLALVHSSVQGVVSNPPIRPSMHALASRILVALLVLSQTWTGALRGIELCIPVGLCEGCGLESAAHDHDHNCDHSHDHAHASQHAHAHGGTLTLEPACVCHIHVATPDDDSHRGARLCANFVLTAATLGAVDCWILAAWDRSASSSQRFGVDDPPDGGAPSLFEQVVIEATVLLV